MYQLFGTVYPYCIYSHYLICKKMVANNRIQSPIIPELDAFLSKSIAAEEEVAMLKSRLAIIAKKQLSYPQRRGA